MALRNHTNLASDLITLSAAWLALAAASAAPSAAVAASFQPALAALSVSSSPLANVISPTSPMAECSGIVPSVYLSLRYVSRRLQYSSVAFGDPLPCTLPHCRGGLRKMGSWYVLCSAATSGGLMPDGRLYHVTIPSVSCASPFCADSGSALAICIRTDSSSALVICWTLRAAFDLPAV